MSEFSDQNLSKNNSLYQGTLVLFRRCCTDKKKCDHNKCRAEKRYQNNEHDLPKRLPTWRDAKHPRLVMRGRG